MIQKLTLAFTAIFGPAIFLTIARIAGAGLGIILQILIARHYGAQVLGSYYLVLSMAGILSIFISMGYPWIVAPILAANEDDKSSTALADSIRLFFRDALAVSLLIGGPIAIYIWLYPGIGAEQRFALFIGLTTAPIYAVMRMCGSIANAKKFFNLAGLPELFLRPLLMLVIVGLIILFAFELTASSIVLINLLISIGLTGWMAISLNKSDKTGILKRMPGISQSGSDASNLRRLAIPMIFSTLFINMFADLDILIIGLILPADQAGIFGVAMKIAALLLFTVQITHQILLRDASNAHLSGDSGKMQEIIKKANIFAVSASLASLIALVLLGNFVLGLFGTQFMVAYYCLVGLVIAQVIRALSGPAIQVLMITNNQKTGIPVYISSAIILVAANLILVPIFQYEGAALAVIITTLVWSVWLALLTKRKTGYSTSILQ
jgi:O-antigen/teichoic acid export membrane protein